MWKHLKNRQIEGRRFTKQHSIGNFIVDFYCPSEMLILELDGQGHFNPVGEDYDEKRSKFLKDLGFNVLRFENKRVLEDLDRVLVEIKINFLNNVKD